ncbi:transmembrane and immunoglobulin domain-containing protein 2-like [Conger conger]|uniref:transmembrane and immunoglobulin domain-containing protein 2-like n=1 Tax=Conger conger TaxID=82655 RepID=UPI002A5AF043|nr:transmembrane and immunoglobulin domain-containing protein 2-like [Conger conger]
MSQLTALHSCLILSFLSSCGNNEVLRVIQYPPDITVEEGETAHMQCCWGWGSQKEQVRLEWKNSTSKIYDHLINMSSTVYQTTSTNLAKEGEYGSSISGNCSNFSISGVSMNHAGVFICVIQAEIPYFMTGEGNGTQLTVKPRPGTNTPSLGNNEVLRVIQYPSDITMEEGETAHMQCCWGWGSQMEQVQLIWENSTSKIYYHRIDMRSTVYQTTSTNLAKEGKYDSSISGKCSDFSISGVSMNHAGVFICSIQAEIPYYIAGKGNRTRLTVKPRPGTDTTPQAVEESGASVEEVLIFILRCLPFLALLTAVFCLCWIEAKAADRAPEGSGREEENEADNEPATSLLEAADAEVVGGRIVVPCPTPSSGQPETENETITPVIS